MTTKAAWYPEMPPRRPDETTDQCTNRLTGADRTNRVPYDHRRGRQCSIGYHHECSDRDNTGSCECPCHDWRRHAEDIVGRWNAANPIGATVTFPPTASEPPTITTSDAYIDRFGDPVVDLDGFPGAVLLAWIVEAPQPPRSALSQGER